MDSEIIYGNRIYLKPIAAGDTAMVLEWRNSGRTVRNFYYRKPVTEEDHKKWLAEKVDRGEVWQYVVLLKETDTPIGCVYIQHIDPATMTGETGVFFSEDAPAGQGLATEAVKLLGDEVGFNKLGLLHLEAKVISSNIASMRLHEKAGYHISKEVKGETCTDGEVVASTYFIRDVQVYRCDRKPVIRAKTGKIKELEDGSLEITVPGSKSITNRALLIAMLADGESVLNGVLFSDDTESLLDCMEGLGIETDIDRGNCIVRVKGCGGHLPKKEASLNVGSAGTAARFLTAVLGATDGGIYHMDSSDQMKKRPMAPLLDSLKELGCEVIYEGEEGHFPFTLKPHGFKKDEISVNIEKSSQFLSALLIAAPLSGRDIRMNLVGKANLSYVEMTRKVMASFGLSCNGISGETAGSPPEGSDMEYTGYIAKSGIPKAAVYDIEPDASAAAYFYALSPLINRSVTVKGLGWNSMQGDVCFINCLGILGMAVNTSDEGDFKVVPLALGPKKAIPIASKTEMQIDSGAEPDAPKTVSMASCSDQTMTLAALAPSYGKPLVIEYNKHLRLQESDRAAAIVNELNRAGSAANIEENDRIFIRPGKLIPADIETYGDHRMAMAFSLLGVKEKGISILDPMCCSKTFPDYFAYFDEIMNLTSTV